MSTQNSYHFAWGGEFDLHLRFHNNGEAVDHARTICDAEKGVDVHVFRVDGDKEKHIACVTRCGLAKYRYWVEA